MLLVEILRCCVAEGGYLCVPSLVCFVCFSELLICVYNLRGRGEFSCTTLGDLMEAG